jgi:DNA-binding beta-propeller fold protein YncE
MKLTTSNFARTIASTLLSLCVLASAGFAAKKPISYPRGLAVDAKGNLYVANSGGNDILVYNTAYTQTTAKTITQGISNPTGVAFDAQGSLWVSNYGTSNGGANCSVSKYTNGAQVKSASITNGILGPGALALDGLGDVWVQNDNINVTVYSQFDETVKTIAPPGGAFVFGLTASQGWVSMGGNNQTSSIHTTVFLAGEEGIYEAVGGGNNGIVLASDANSNVYMGNSDGTVNIYNLRADVASTFINVGFEPSGLAIDSTRGRVYVANYNANQILVYSTAGAFLHTIE